MQKIKNIIKLQDFTKEEIYNYCINRYNKDDYYLQFYPDKNLLLSFFEVVYKNYKSLKYDIEKGHTILRGDIISGYTYKKDIPVYNKDDFEDLIDNVFGHTIFCELTRNYNQLKKLNKN